MDNSNKYKGERYDGIDIMESLQVGTRQKSDNNLLGVNIEKMLGSVSDIMDTTVENDLSISPFDYYQLESGILIKKETPTEYINATREDIYDFLCGTLGGDIVDNYLVMLNNVISLDCINDFVLRIADDEVLENLYVLSIIELDIIGKKILSKALMDKVLNNSKYGDTYRIIGYYLYHVGDYPVAYKFLSKLVRTDFIKKDKELLKTYILLNKKVNNYEGIYELLGFLGEILDSEKKSDSFNPETEDFKKDLEFAHSNYLDYYLKMNNNPDNIEQVALESIELGNEHAYFHLIYACLQKKDYQKASDYYNNWELVDDENEIVFSEDNLNDLEEFYTLGVDIQVLGSMDLLVDFYREQFRLHGYNEDYFDLLMEYVIDGEYDFTDKDIIFFEKISIHMEELDNDLNILDLIDMLFKLYSNHIADIYLEKILLILSKKLHNKYKNNLDINIKRSFTIGFESLIIIDELNSQGITDNDLFNKMIKEKAKLLSDINYLNAIFDELTLKFCSDTLVDIIENTHEESNIPIYLASIFDYYGCLDSANIALEYDDYFKEIKKAPRLN